MAENKIKARIVTAAVVGSVRLHISNTENSVTRARLKLSLTQEAFAKLLDTPIGTVRGWEQGRRKPPPCAELLMRVAMNYPDQVLECAIDAPEIPVLGVDEAVEEHLVFHQPGGNSDFWLL